MSRESRESREPSELQLGYVAGVHGVHGALRVKLFNPETESLVAGLELSLRDRQGNFLRRVRVARAAPKPGSDVARMWLEGVESREAADGLRGTGLWIDRSALPQLDADEYYLADLIGRAVVRDHEGRREGLGVVTGVTTNSAQDLLVVKLRGREWLVPAMPPFVVDVGEQIIVDVHVDMLPEGATPEPLES